MKTLSKKQDLNFIFCQLRFTKANLIKSILFRGLFLCMLIPSVSDAQLSLGTRVGYDQPLFNTPYSELKYKGGQYLGAHLDYRFLNSVGVRFDYANIKTRSDILIPDKVFYGTTPFTTLKDKIDVKRNFIGLGPSYSFGNSKFSMLVSPMAGYSWINGGDALVESSNPLGGMDTHLINTGFDDQGLAAKLDLDFNYNITKNLRLTLGTYYLRHFGVHFDNMLDIDGSGPYLIAHGEGVFDQTPNPYTVTNNPPNIVRNESDKPMCMDLASVGLNLGLSYTFGKLKTTTCETCGCPDDGHKVVVTVRDEASQKVIPNTDVAIKDLQGNIIATGTTNSFGVVDFGEIPHGNYTAIGNVYGVETTISTILDAEFLPDAVIQKEVLYTDLRFILKGQVINKATGRQEPNVVVSLTNDQDGDVKQDNSDGKGAFLFRLNKNSSYSIVGVKEHKLSDIERASTIGLTRSTTLFVDLELGVDDFDCGKGTVLDVKYEYDKWFLTTNAKFELDRLVRYMQDHSGARIELSSHTDSRGTNQYNQTLSQKRAQSAVDYIVANGISNNRIIAQGYGETRLLNQCADGINCSEAEHRINRRTEAKLICN